MTTYDFTGAEGWAVEPEDPTVGIFGDTVYHEACPGERYNDEDSFTEDNWYTIGEGVNRILVTVLRYSCGDCHAEGVVRELDAYPDFPGID